MSVHGPISSDIAAQANVGFQGNNGSRCRMRQTTLSTQNRRARYGTAFALSRAVKVGHGLREGLTEAERCAVADHVVAQPRERGDPW